jgi:hypothetical protein
VIRCLLHHIEPTNLYFFGVNHDPKLFRMMAGTTGLEPATSAVTGQRSNQLSYVPKNVFDTLVCWRQIGPTRQQKLVYQILFPARPAEPWRTPRSPRSLP